MTETRQDMAVKSANEVGVASFTEVFVTRSGTAYDLATNEICHPKDARGKCVYTLCADDSNGRVVLLLNPNPTQDEIKNWNTGKYKEAKVTGIEVTAGVQIPAEFSSVENFYRFTPTRVIVVTKMEPAGNNLLLDASPLRENVTSPQPSIGVTRRLGCQ